jgi:integrase
LPFRFDEENLKRGLSFTLSTELGDLDLLGEVTGIGDFHFHDLRHTFATRLRAANVHKYDIADLLGHSTTPGDTRNTKVTRG